MKLIVSNLDALRTYVSREMYFIQHELITTHGWTHIECDRLWYSAGTLENKLRNALGTLPDVVLFWEAYELLYMHAFDIQRLKSRKVFFADDLHWWDRRMREMKLLSFAVSDLILSTYAYGWHKLYPEISFKRVEWVPHAASSDFMLSCNDEPENAIFLSGAINDVYPLREQMLKLHREGRYAIKYHHHPGYYCGYDYETDARVGRGFAEMINGCRVGFTDSAFPYRYVVAKFFEIPATGALLLADDAVSAQLERLGFVAGRDYVSVSSNNLEERVQYVLDENNRGELDRVRRNGQALVHERHKTTDRARQINELVLR